MAKQSELRVVPPFPQPAKAAQVLMSRRAAERVRAGHPWVYRTDLEQTIPAQGAGDVPPGSLVIAADNRGIPLGVAMYSSASQIALRLIAPSRGPVAQALLGTSPFARSAFLSLLQERLRAAIRLRWNMGLFADPDTDSFRLAFAEADELPGLVVDRYAGMVILQLLHQAMDAGDVREAVVAVLHQEVPAEVILQRPDPRIRELEQLSPPSAEPLWSRGDAPALTTVFRLNGLAFHYDANAGQKTGAFLDQRENYAAAARHAHGEALDICTYQGGFALHMAQRCTSVTGVDVSRSALKVAERNLELNRPGSDGGAEVDWLQADAFELLRDYSDSGRQFDTVVLDPPAFAKSKRAAEGALRGYKELNLRALKMLRPGGVLVTCSCSHHVPLDEFIATVAAAAGDAGRRVRLVEVRGAAEDHPAILTVPETSYLKCLICRVE